jgi:hypothetical protein
VFKVAFLPRLEILGAVDHSLDARANERWRVDCAAQSFGSIQTRIRSKETRETKGIDLGSDGSQTPPTKDERRSAEEDLWCPDSPAEEAEGWDEIALQDAHLPSPICRC